MKFRLYFFTFIFFLISSSINAKPRCDIFYEKIKNNYDILSLDNERISEERTMGFDIQVKFDKSMARIVTPGESTFKVDDYVPLEKVINLNKQLRQNQKKLIRYQEGDWDADRSNDGYYMVGDIWLQRMAALVNQYDEIISINGRDLRDLDFSRKKNYNDINYLEDYFGKEENLEIVIRTKDKNNETYERIIKTTWEDINYTDPYLDYYVRAVSIDEKEGTSTITIEKHFEEILSKDFPLTTLAREILFYDDKDKPWFEECEYTDKEWSDLDTIDPNYGIKFKNMIYKDKTKFSGYYLIYPSLVGTWDFITEDTLSIQYKSVGEYKFKNKFNFKSFPFDKQEIRVFLYQSRYALGEFQASVSDWTKRELLALEEENPITGWDIVGNKLLYKTNKGPNDEFYQDGVELVLEIERKSGYYVFKVILPIILILVVCWSAIWIHPKEIESRLTITIVCLLSLIAYNFVIDSEMPKLEYLTIMDYIILISYFYATVPNFLSIAQYQYLIKKKTSLCNKYGDLGKRYGFMSYITFLIIIILINTGASPENTNAMLSWLAPNF